MGEWIMGTIIGKYIGTINYYKDPFPHSLLSTRQRSSIINLNPKTL